MALAWVQKQRKIVLAGGSGDGSGLFPAGRGGGTHPEHNRHNHQHDWGHLVGTTLHPFLGAMCCKAQEGLRVGTKVWGRAFIAGLGQMPVCDKP